MFLESLDFTSNFRKFIFLEIKISSYMGKWLLKLQLKNIYIHYLALNPKILFTFALNRKDLKKTSLYNNQDYLNFNNLLMCYKTQFHIIRFRGMHRNCDSQYNQAFVSGGDTEWADYSMRCMHAYSMYLTPSWRSFFFITILGYKINCTI